MRTGIKKSLKRKIRVGRVGVPVWVLGLALLAAAAAAGQAVGPVLTGGVSGSAGLTIEQSVLLSSTTTAHDVTGHGSDNDLVVVNDEGTAFTAAIELHVGDKPVLNLDLDNVSDASANAILQLNVPTGVDVEVSSGSGVEESQLNRNTWLLRVATSTANTTGAASQLNIDISPKDDLKPGFYTITGRIIQVAN